jgi:hypothetical protein
VKRHSRYALLVLILAAPAVSSRAQGDAVPPFPEILLDGIPKFDLAVFYQSDLRGNFGPCG